MNVTSSASGTSVIVQVSENDLLCKNDCGFYGNPEWNGYCSKCYREHQSQLKRQSDYQRNRKLLSFNDFEKKKDAQRKPNWRSVLRISPTRDDREQQETITQTTPVRHVSRPVAHIRRPHAMSPESSKAREVFIKFLKEEMPKAAAHEASTCASKTVENVMAHSRSMSANEIADQIQDAYHTIRLRLQRYKNVDADVIDQCMRHIEEYICVRCYDYLFCNDAEEEAADLSLQTRIRSLHWVTSGFVETCLDMTVAEVHERMEHAYTSLIDMNAKRTIRDKMQCLLNCSENIFAALKISRGGAPASADEYLPALILSILSANPPQLQSNLRFIRRFALPGTIETGEAGYYFTNLSCALKFVQNLSPSDLRLQPEEFEAYTAGNLRPPPLMSHTGAHYMLKTLDSNAHRLSNLEKQLQAIDTVADDAEKKMKRVIEEHSQRLEEEVQNFASADEFVLAEPPRLLQNDNGRLCLCKTVAKNKEDDIKEPAPSTGN